jgi:hypothetical protein
MRGETTYFCQSCDHSLKSRKLLYGKSCPSCDEGVLDDWPKGVEVGVPYKDEQSLDYFNRYIAGDR